MGRWTVFGARRTPPASDKALASAQCHLTAMTVTPPAAMPGSHRPRSLLKLQERNGFGVAGQNPD